MVDERENIGMRAMGIKRKRLSGVWLAAALLVAGGRPLPAAEESAAAEPVLSRCLISLVEEARVPAREAGVLVELSIKEGDTLARGDTIARIDDSQPRFERRKAQAEHDAMLKLYEEADKLRKDADDAQEKFIEAKLTADEEHREHIEHIRQVHDFDKIISGIRDRTRKARKEKDDSTAKREAEEIFDKFKSGEKLSTEDIMVLQKSGYM